MSDIPTHFLRAGHDTELQEEKSVKIREMILR